MKLFSTMARLAPALASGLITYGVTAEHAEPIAIGMIAAGCALVEWIVKMREPKKG